MWPAGKADSKSKEPTEELTFTIRGEEDLARRGAKASDDT